MHSFYIDGVSCRQYGIMVSGSGTFNAPERDVETVEIPGRNGTLTIDKGRWRNITVTYKACIPHNFISNAAAARVWLSSLQGYHRLEDDYNLDTYRMARYNGALTFEPAPQLRGAEFELSFDCMPQRFLKMGEIEVDCISGTVLHNPTLFAAQPLITVTGTGDGSLSIAGTTVSLSDIGGAITLDCESQRAYSGVTPMDSHMAGNFSTLPAGDCSVTFSGGITAVKIIPRWWTL